MDSLKREEIYSSSPTIRRLLYGPSANMDKTHRTVLRHGSRAIHGSQVLSESAKVVANRPLSPNLILKKPQLSATYSISHRIFGAILASAILLPPAMTKLSLMFDV